jgi:hypothetical protein
MNDHSVSIRIVTEWSFILSIKDSDWLVIHIIINTWDEWVGDTLSHNLIIYN